MMQAKEYLNADELSKFDKFAEALDSAVINRYHSVLQDLKVERAILYNIVKNRYTCTHICSF